MMDEDTLKVVTSRILLESMTREDRDKLLEGALKSLLTEPASRDIYSRDKRTKFQEAFDTAVAACAMTLIKEHLQTPEVRELLRVKIAAATEVVLNGAEFETRLAQRITAGLWKDE